MYILINNILGMEKGCKRVIQPRDI